MSYGLIWTFCMDEEVCLLLCMEGSLFCFWQWHDHRCWVLTFTVTWQRDIGQSLLATIILEAWNVVSPQLRGICCEMLVGTAEMQIYVILAPLQLFRKLVNSLVCSLRVCDVSVFLRSWDAFTQWKYAIITIITSLNIYCWVCWWKNIENCSTFVLYYTVCLCFARCWSKAGCWQLLLNAEFCVTANTQPWRRANSSVKSCDYVVTVKQLLCVSKASRHSWKWLTSSDALILNSVQF